MSSLTHGISVGMIAVDAVSESLWPRLGGLLDGAERQRTAHFLTERDRRRQVALHALKRLMLSACAPGIVLPNSWRFTGGGGGAARVLDRAGPYFSVSHCDGLVACGVSRRFRLGIDVKPLADCASVAFARSQFTEREMTWLSEQPSEARPEALFRLWTLKEAYRNTSGTGPAQIPDFVGDFDPQRLRFRETAPAEAASWHFRQVDIGQRHTLALAWQAGARKVPIDVRAVHVEEMLFGVGHEGRSTPWRFGSRPMRRRGARINLP